MEIAKIASSSRSGMNQRDDRGYVLSHANSTGSYGGDMGRHPWYPGKLPVQRGDHMSKLD